MTADQTKSAGTVCIKPEGIANHPVIPLLLVTVNLRRATVIPKFSRLSVAS
jgi:hypothetical protein